MSFFKQCSAFLNLERTSPLESVFFELFLKSQIPYSSWGLGVYMKLLGANHFDDTAKPTEYSDPQFLLNTVLIGNREKLKN